MSDDLAIRFEHASRLTPHARVLYLAELRLNDPDASRELESLLVFERSAARELSRIVERAASHVAASLGSNKWVGLFVA